MKMANFWMTAIILVAIAAILIQNSAVVWALVLVELVLCILFVLTTREQ